MTVVREYAAYYSDLDDLIRQRVGRLVRDGRARLTRCYWERGFAGGPHLRVKLMGSADAVEAVATQCVESIGQFIAEHPSEDRVHYSPAAASALLAVEGQGHASAERVAYRNNALIECAPSQTTEAEYASPEAASLMEDFKHASAPLATSIIESERPRRQTMLRLYFVHALLIGKGHLPKGSVSFRSHWDGFSANWASDDIITRIEGAYAARRDSIRAEMLDLLDRYRRAALSDDPIDGEWASLFTTFRTRVRQLLNEGRHITRQPTNREEARQFRAQIEQQRIRESAFLTTFCSDDEFLASIQHAPGMLTARVLVNLLYVLVAAVGLTPLDRFALCFVEHRAVEEHFECDLIDLLKVNMSKVKNTGRPI